MNPNSFLVLASIWLIMFWYNRLAPMMGDDYLYSCIIDERTIFYNFEPETAVRINSVADIVISQWNHYFLWGGRTVAHFIDQFFLWRGELLFDVCNASVFVLLIMEVHWIVDRGRVSLDFKPSRLIWIFVGFWIFSINFASTFLWTTGACNYLWTAVILLAFLMPFVRQWFSDRPLEINPPAMLIAGVIAGWTNENTVCWFIIAIALMCRRLRAEGRLRSWLIFGLIGLSIGYALLIFAPGNFARAVINTPNARGVIFDDPSEATILLSLNFLFQFIVWYFFVRTLMNQKAFGAATDIRRSLLTAKFFALISLLSNFILFLSPEFSARSFFPSLIYLLIAVTILIRLQHETNRNTIPLSLKIFLHTLGGIIFAVSFCASMMYMTIYGNYFAQIQRQVERESVGADDKIINVSPLDFPEWFKLAAASHTPSNFLDRRDDKDFWINKAYGRYYGVKEVRLNDDEQSD